MENLSRVLFFCHLADNKQGNKLLPCHVMAFWTITKKRIHSNQITGN